jgi:hypothetical protein
LAEPSGVDESHGLKLVDAQCDAVQLARRNPCGLEDSDRRKAGDAARLSRPPAAARAAVGRASVGARGALAAA